MLFSIIARWNVHYDYMKLEQNKTIFSDVFVQFEYQLIPVENMNIFYVPFILCGMYGKVWTP